MKINIHNSTGKKVGQMELTDDVFGVAFNEAVVHQALIRQLANRRLGTADTKTRGEVNKSTRKMFAQKHTGRARRGSAKSPLLKGGGVVFGPHPRSYRQDMPKKMRRLAIRCILSAKAKDGELKVLDELAVSEPKTKKILDILVALGIGTSVIMATVETEDNVVKSARNLPGVKVMPARLLNVADLLSFKMLVLTAGAVQVIEELWGQKEVKKVPANIA